MKTTAMLLPWLVPVLAGCAQTTPAWDARFGDSVRQARAQQTIDPTASSRPAAPMTLDGKAVAGAQRGYGISYGYTLREPAPPTPTLLVTPLTSVGQ
jgi:hypothetical protein